VLVFENFYWFFSGTGFVTQEANKNNFKSNKQTMEKRKLSLHDFGIVAVVTSLVLFIIAGFVL
jgi:hypothetical protein